MHASSRPEVPKTLKLKAIKFVWISLGNLLILAGEIARSKTKKFEILKINVNPVPKIITLLSGRLKCTLGTSYAFIFQELF